MIGRDGRTIEDIVRDAMARLPRKKQKGFPPAVVAEMTELVATFAHDLAKGAATEAHLQKTQYVSPNNLVDAENRLLGGRRRKGTFWLNTVGGILMGSGVSMALPLVTDWMDGKALPRTPALTACAVTVVGIVVLALANRRG